VPKGLHKFSGEGDDMNLREIEDNADEEGKVAVAPTQKMAALNMWVHYTPSILK